MLRIAKWVITPSRYETGKAADEVANRGGLFVSKSSLRITGMVALHYLIDGFDGLAHISHHLHCRL
jgi:hypothetical protein